MDTHKVKGTSCVYKQAFGCVMSSITVLHKKVITQLVTNGIFHKENITVLGTVLITF